MNVRELIEVLGKADPEATVIHSTGIMQDYEEVLQVMTAEYVGVKTAWNGHGKALEPTNWIVLY